MLFSIALMSPHVYSNTEAWQLLSNKNGFKLAHVQRNVVRTIRERKIPGFTRTNENNLGLH